MKKAMSFVFVVVALVGLSLVWYAMQVNAAIPSVRAQAVNTPVALVDRSSVVSQLPSALDPVKKPEQPQSEAPVAEQPVQKETDPERVRQKAEALRRAGVHFPVVNGDIGVNQVASPQAGETCSTMLLNSKMDVVELGGGQGSIDYWSIVSQKIYYDSEAYNSSSYSLVMLDEQNGSDTALISPTLDYDAFGQGFMAPTQLTVITVTYSRQYSNTDSYDDVYANLWILDSQGNLGDTYYWWSVSETPSSWTNRYMAFTDPADLAFISGKPWALVFEMYSDRTPPAEIVWLDDAQVTLCYMAGTHKVYLPLAIKSPPPPTGPTCTPVEPDAVATRGTTAVGAICHGAFDTIDDKDYYSLDPNGVSNVRLWLRNIPANYGAAIFEDTTGYPLLCYIVTAGSQDKSADCTLNVSRKYFVKVDRGPWGGGNYDMSVVAR